MYTADKVWHGSNKQARVKRLVYVEKQASDDDD